MIIRASARPPHGMAPVTPGVGLPPVDAFAPRLVTRPRGFF